jgi:hypothetical protein
MASGLLEGFTREELLTWPTETLRQLDSLANGEHAIVCGTKERRPERAHREAPRSFTSISSVGHWPIGERLLGTRALRSTKLLVIRTRYPDKVRSPKIMAIFILGTACRLCGTPMVRDDEIITFQSFVPNKLDPLYLFCDDAFHRRCFDEHPLSEKARRYADRAQEQGLPQNRACLVCGQAITEPDDYCGTGYITSDSASPAFHFNYLRFHKRHFEQWDKASEFRRAIEELMHSGQWDGPKLAFVPWPTWKL